VSTGPARTLSRRGLPLLLAGLGLFAYQALSPQLPRERTITYRYPPPTATGALEVRWSQGAETLGQARFVLAPGQRQSSHRLLLAEGEYQLETQLPAAPPKARTLRVDAESFTVVLE
jgi:hypothetical protein